MYFVSRGLGVLFLFISLAIGYYLATSVGMGSDVGYTVGCILGALGWVVVVSLARSQRQGKSSPLATHPAPPSSSPTPSSRPPIELTKKCPFCAETIKAEAIVCRFCGRDLPSPTPEYTWEDLQPLFDKWMHIADIPEVLSLCREISRSTSDAFLDLLRRNAENGNLSTNVKESSKRGEKYGAAVGSTMRASFMIGLEYGDQRRGSHLSSEEITSVAKEALPMLRVVVNPTLELAASLALLLEKSAGGASSLDVEGTVKRLAPIILKDSLACFRAGLQYGTPS